MVQKFNCYILLTLCEEAYVLKADLSICNMAFGSAVCYFKNYWIPSSVRVMIFKYVFSVKFFWSKSHWIDSGINKTTFKENGPGDWTVTTLKVF